MTYVYEDLNLYYNIVDGEGIPLLFLHGWGCNSNIWKFNIDELKSYHKKIIVLDFFGFGKSSEPFYPYEITNYQEAVISLLTYLKIKKVIIIAHSFGARVAIKLATETNLVEKLLLIGAAGLRPKFSFRKYIKIKIYKLKKLFKLNISKYGSLDYQNSSPIMKQTLIKVVNYYQDEELPKIKCETLLYWGRNDNATPLYMARKMQKKIKNSKLIIEENAGHFVFLQNINQFNKLILDFVRK